MAAGDSSSTILELSPRFYGLVFSPSGRLQVESNATTVVDEVPLATARLVLIQPALVGKLSERRSRWMPMKLYTV